MQNSYACLLIGLGKIGMGYDYELDNSLFLQTHASAVSAHPLFKLSGAVETDPGLRKKFESKYQCSVYESVEDAMQETSADIVIIAVPTLYHIEIIEKVLKSKSTKIILCEKPLAYTFEEASKIYDKCKKNNVDLFVNYMWRSDPGAIEVKKRIENNSISLPIRGAVWYSKGFLHNGSHFFNLLEYWLGDFKESKIIDSGRKINNYDFEPHVLAIFGKSEISFIPVKEEQYSYYSIELHSDNGRLYWSFTHDLSWQSVKKNIDKNISAELSSNIETICTDMNKYQLNVLNQCERILSAGSGSICKGEEALHTLKSMNKIIKQLKK